MGSQGTSQGSSRGSEEPTPTENDAYDRASSTKETVESATDLIPIATYGTPVLSGGNNKVWDGNGAEMGVMLPVSDSDSSSRKRQEQPSWKPGHNRVASLDMRKLPVNVILKPSIIDNTSQISEDLEKENRGNKISSGSSRNFIRCLCLRPQFTIRTQLMLSFGTINAVTILVVVAVCILTTTLAGENIKDISKSSFEALERESQGRTARHVARALNERLLPDDEVNLLREVVWDRFMGYPNPTDDDVPFLDMESKRRFYPVIGTPLPLDWQLEPNVEEGSYDEHFQGRNFWKTHLDQVSTLNAGFTMQGSCDPSVDDRNDPRYWPNCTVANNDISTGGMVAPSPTTSQIHRKGSDIVPVLKALFESKEEMRDVGIYFTNEGAGAAIVYPQTVVDTRWTYVSAGCEWMNQPNPYNLSQTIGTQDMIDRCHPLGETVSARAYNALETEWCSRQALNPERLIVSIAPDVLEGGQSWVLAAGKAVYDRLTHEFIGCTYVGISLLEVEDELKLASTITDKSEVSIVVYNEIGTVVASSVDGLAAMNIPVSQADLGVTKGSYDALYNLVDFETEWVPKEVMTKYESFKSTDGPFLVSVYPIPPVPDAYDPAYRPLLLAVMSTAVDELFEVVRDVNEGVDDRVNRLITFSVIVGAVGLAVATVIIFFMSHLLTNPLNAMNDVANEIVNNFGDSTKEGKIGGTISQKMAGLRCSPHTEIDDVVREFNRMVTTFSGKLMAKSEKGRIYEVTNQLGLRRDLYDLYMRRGDEDFKYAAEPPVKLASTSIRLRGGSKMSFCHRGSNLVSCPTSTNTATTIKQSGSSKSSSLFLWIVGLIVTPLLIANISIAVVVMQTVSGSFSDGVAKAEDFFLDVQRRALYIHSLLMADYLSSLTRQSTRDAFLLARYSSWLLFGGLTRADAFMEVTTGVDDCKSHSDDMWQCPYVESEYVCDCAWEETRTNMPCSKFPNGSRYLQIPWWASESGAALEDGDRMSTLYPLSSSSPETIEYWSDPFELPGSERGANASGYDTAYDRLRTMSAMPLMQVIYNRENVQDYFVNAFLAFEADGLVFGYRGCKNIQHVALGWYRISAVDTVETRPDICMEGKYGYDPRCREWYDKGRRLAMYNNTFLHVTSPYRFATTLEIAQTTTIPVIDPATNEHVGQWLIDFYADPLIHELDSHDFLSEEGFPFLVSAQSDDNSDTVMAPGYFQNDTAPPIGQQILPADFLCTRPQCVENMKEFDAIVNAMKEGRGGSTTLLRTRQDGGEERLLMGFAPVDVKGYRLIDSSDFSRGVEVASYLIYSVALAEPEADILKPFDPIEEETEDQIRVATIVLSVLIALSTLVVAYISHQVATSISAPMVYLLDLIRLINSQENAQPPPQSSQSINTSREVAMFSETMEMLFTLLRSANAAFYGGELELAHSILLDALRLFKRLGNKKAVGIANNNLGNVVFAMYQQMKANKQHRIGGMTRLQIVKSGVGYYLKAIQLGEELSDEFHVLQGWSPACLEFTQHLANRYFNRGLFLLIAKHDHKSPTELEELGRRDLMIARDMDIEVISYGEEIGWNSPERIERAFDVKISRARGYNMLLEHGYKDEWDIQEVLDDAFDMIKTAKQQDSSPLFTSMSIAGRMQVLEIELMKYKLRTGDLETAARVAVRMILEDELVFLDAQSQAVDVLLQYISFWPDLDESERAKLERTLNETRAALEEAAEDQLLSSMTDFGSSASSAVTTRTSAASNPRGRPSHVWSLRQSGGRFVTMEDF